MCLCWSLVFVGWLLMLADGDLLRSSVDDCSSCLDPHRSRAACGKVMSRSEVCVCMRARARLYLRNACACVTLGYYPERAVGNAFTFSRRPIDPSKKKSGWPARPAWRAGQAPYHILYHHILHMIYNLAYLCPLIPKIEQRLECLFDCLVLYESFGTCRVAMYQ